MDRGSTLISPAWAVSAIATVGTKTMARHRWTSAILALLVLGSGISFWRAVVSPWIWPHAEESDFDPYPDSNKAVDLPSDLKLMWETQRLGGTPDPTHGPNPRSSTARAINAASRVFNTVELLGKTRDQVVTLLGDPKSSSDSIYNFPFWPTPKGAMVYRFDSGACGWQFNIELDAEGKVSKVERLWIH